MNKVFKRYGKANWIDTRLSKIFKNSVNAYKALAVYELGAAYSSSATTMQAMAATTPATSDCPAEFKIRKAEAVARTALETAHAVERMTEFYGELIDNETKKWRASAKR